MDKFGLPENTIEKIKNLFKTINDIEEVKIFGSRSIGNYKPNSDIDFAICGKNIDEYMIRHIAAELDELPTPYKFDVINYNSIDNPKLKDNIDKYGKVFYIHN